MSDPRPPWWLKPMNKLNMAVQKLGIPTVPVRILSVVGRKSGQPRKTPMTRYSNWMARCTRSPATPNRTGLNARAAGTGTLTRGRKSQRVAIVELRGRRRPADTAGFPTRVLLGGQHQELAQRQIEVCSLGDNYQSHRRLKCLRPAWACGQQEDAEFPNGQTVCSQLERGQSGRAWRNPLGLNTKRRR